MQMASDPSCMFSIYNLEISITRFGQLEVGIFRIQDLEPYVA